MLCKKPIKKQPNPEKAARGKPYCISITYIVWGVIQDYISKNTLRDNWLSVQ